MLLVKKYARQCVTAHIGSSSHVQATAEQDQLAISCLSRVQSCQGVSAVLSDPLYVPKLHTPCADSAACSLQSPGQAFYTQHQHDSVLALVQFYTFRLLYRKILDHTLTALYEVQSN